MTTHQDIISTMASKIGPSTNALATTGFEGLITYLPITENTLIDSGNSLSAAFLLVKNTNTSQNRYVNASTPTLNISQNTLSSGLFGAYSFNISSSLPVIFARTGTNSISGNGSIACMWTKIMGPNF